MTNDINSGSIAIVKSSQQLTITDGATGIHLRSSVLICPHLRFKKENFFTADDKGWTLIHADEEKRDRNNSDANRFDMTND